MIMMMMIIIITIRKIMIIRIVVVVVVVVFIVVVVVVRISRHGLVVKMPGSLSWAPKYKALRRACDVLVV